VKNQGDLQRSMKTGKRLKAKRPVFHKGKKEDPGNNVTIIFTSAGKRTSS